jgi:hypothetical protein
MGWLDVGWRSACFVYRWLQRTCWVHRGNVQLVESDKRVSLEPLGPLWRRSPQSRPWRWQTPGNQGQDQQRISMLYRSMIGLSRLKWLGLLLEYTHAAEKQLRGQGIMASLWHVEWMLFFLIAERPRPFPYFLKFVPADVLLETTAFLELLI